MMIAEIIAEMDRQIVQACLANGLSYDPTRKALDGQARVYHCYQGLRRSDGSYPVLKVGAEVTYYFRPNADHAALIVKAVRAIFDMAARRRAAYCEGQRRYLRSLKQDGLPFQS